MPWCAPYTHRLWGLGNRANLYLLLMSCVTLREGLSSVLWFPHLQMRVVLVLVMKVLQVSKKWYL